MTSSANAEKARVQGYCAIYSGNVRWRSFSVTDVDTSRKQM